MFPLGSVIDIVLPACNPLINIKVGSLVLLNINLSTLLATMVEPVPNF